MKQQFDNKVTPLLGEIVEDMQKLLRQEVILAKTEIKEDVKRIKSAFISIVIGMILGELSLILCAFSGVQVLLLIEGMRLWEAYLIAGIAISVFAFLFLIHAHNLVTSVKGKPEKTLGTIKENIEWIQQKI